MISASILGCAGTHLTPEEAAFFRDVQPWGFIVFKRNIDTPDQLKALVGDLRATVGRADAPVLIDQEGGRVQRLGPPHWPRYPNGGAYGGRVGVSLGQKRATAWLGGRLMGADLGQLGINVDCLPVLDVPHPGAHDVIGDRAYGDTPDVVASLGRAAAEGLIAGGVLPVIKHIPGHGRAGADSHLDLPVVDASWDELDAVDFAPFRALSDMPLAMTAHVVYAAVDAKRPATTSEIVIERVIRGAIGFDGLLMSDDLSMEALSGTLTQRARQSLAAGCDVVLHCNGKMDEMKAVLAGTRALEARAAQRAAAALARIPKAAEAIDTAAARAELEAALAGVWTP
ncbi:MAG TPA: beta-N-acetylhexosaminidase [Caulobacteraceae bacterium]